MNLPRPIVEVVNTSDGADHVLIYREEGKARSYKVEGADEKERLANTIEKVLGDPVSAEWLP